MIKYFSVENYKSIKNKAILEFDSNLGADYPYPASAVVGFAGANASGKTTILQAITFVFWFMKGSFSEEDIIPCSPFATTSDIPSKFHLIFVYKNSDGDYIDYEYLLAVNQERVLKEEVYYYPNKLQVQELVYKRNKELVEFGPKVHKLDKDVTSALRSNSSIISFLAQFPSQTIAKVFQQYPLFNNVNRSGLKRLKYEPSVVKNIIDNPILETQLVEVLKIADIGIESIKLKPLSNQEKLQYIKKLRGSDEIQDSSFIKQFMESMTSNIQFKHRIDDDLIEFTSLNESAGTLQLIVLLEKIQLAFSQSYLLIFDEIELQLHQNLIAYLIGLFENPSQNLQGGQLLFSFHNTALMEILKPNQLWFTEKNDQGQTEIFSAADFTDIQEIEKRNLEELYRIGRFGAKPRAL